MEKVIACYIVLNEEDWLGLSIESIYDCVDEIIIVEGAEKIFAWTATEDGFSKDKTREIIENYPDKDKKIKYIRVGWVNWQGELRNKYLSMLPDYGWFLMIDGDELYKKEELEKLIEFAKNNPYTLYRVNHLLFDKDVYHLKLDSADMSVNKFFKIFPGLHYNWPGDTGLLGIVQNGYRDHNTNLFHFGYARGSKKLLDKCLWRERYLMHRHGNMTHKDKTDKELKEWLLQTHHFWRKGPIHGIVEYTGDYPLSKEKIEKRWEEILKNEAANSDNLF